MRLKYTVNKKDIDEIKGRFNKRHYRMSAGHNWSICGAPLPDSNLTRSKSKVTCPDCKRRLKGG